MYIFCLQFQLGIQHFLYLDHNIGQSVFLQTGASKGSDQHVHQPSLIKAFDIHIRLLWSLGFPPRKTWNAYHSDQMHRWICYVHWLEKLWRQVFLWCGLFSFWLRVCQKKYSFSETEWICKWNMKEKRTQEKYTPSSIGRTLLAYMLTSGHSNIYSM